MASSLIMKPAAAALCKLTSVYGIGVIPRIQYRFYFKHFQGFYELSIYCLLNSFYLNELEGILLSESKNADQVVVSETLQETDAQEMGPWISYLTWLGFKAVEDGTQTCTWHPWLEHGLDHL